MTTKLESVWDLLSEVHEHLNRARDLAAVATTYCGGQDPLLAEVYAKIHGLMAEVQITRSSYAPAHPENTPRQFRTDRS